MLPKPDDYAIPPESSPDPADLAAARIAQAAVHLALNAYGFPPPPEDLEDDPIQDCLEYLADAQAKGLPPEQARADLVINSYLQAAAEAIALSMNADFPANQKRLFTQAALEWVEGRCWDEDIAFLEPQEAVALTVHNSQE